MVDPTTPDLRALEAEIAKHNAQPIYSADVTTLRVTEAGGDTVEGDQYAIFYRPPARAKDGRMAYGVTFPALVVSPFVSAPEEAARELAADLERAARGDWVDTRDPEALRAHPAVAALLAAERDRLTQELEDAHRHLDDLARAMREGTR